MKQIENIFIPVILLSFLISGCGSQAEKNGFSRSGQIGSDLQHSVDVLAARQDLPELTGEAGLSDYLSYAALNNAGLEAAFNRWQAAWERVEQVKTLPDPRLSYRYFIEEVETRVGAQRQALEIAQMFPWFGKLNLKGDVAWQAAQVQQQQYEILKQSLFFRVKRDYYEYYYLAKAIAVTEENVSLLKHFESVARIRYTVAVGSHPDVIRVQVELGKLEDRLRALQDLRRPTIAGLNSALNRPINTELPEPSEIVASIVSVSDKQLFDMLRENNPALKGLDFEIAGQKQNIELARKNYYPDITLGVNYIDTADSTGGRNPSDDGKNVLAAMVSINVPLWRGKLAAGEREARRRYFSATHGKIEKNNTLNAELELALYRFRDSERKIDLYQNALLPKAREALKVSEASYRAGGADFLDLIDAQRIFLEFELVLERARTDREQSLARVEMLVGRDIADMGNEVEKLNVTDKEGKEQ